MTETDFLIRLGRRIKCIRLEKNMSQNALAIECVIEKASLSRIEAGQSNPTLRTLYKISKALDISFAEFFND